MQLPAALFFNLERQINRIKAEINLRDLAVSSVAMSDKESRTQIHRALVLEQGEIYQIERDGLVQPEPGAISKLKNLSG